MYFNYANNNYYRTYTLPPLNQWCQESIKVVRKKGVFFILDDNGKVKKFKPWLISPFAFLYDLLMARIVFPSKLKASKKSHYRFLQEEFRGLHGRKILELGAGTGDAVEFLQHDNDYTGIDISAGLLRIASRKLKRYGFSTVELFQADACDLPFRDRCFDVAICNLSLNFFKDIDRFISELKRVLKEDAAFYCCVPVPEKINPGADIHGVLYSALELRERFQRQGFNFGELPFENGVLLYFKVN